MPYLGNTWDFVIITRIQLNLRLKRTFPESYCLCKITHVCNF